jgi:hypothetical protein
MSPTQYASRPTLARALCDYIIYNDHNMKKALELCALATQGHDYQDWWWKARCEHYKSNLPQVIRHLKLHLDKYSFNF